MPDRSWIPTRTLRRVALGPALALILVSNAVAADPIVIARPEAFPTLVNPNCSHCIDEAKARVADLTPSDPVLAWIRGKYEGGAIPIRFFLNPYRVISDTYGVFVFDPDAGFARGYEPSLDFRFYGWRNGVVVMKHKDGTLFSTLTGRAFDGPRKGEQLKPVATIPSTWGYWKQAYPGSVAYRMFDKYRPIELSRKDNADSIASRQPADSRLPERTEVLGVSLGKAFKAYPLDRMPKQGGVIRDVLGGENVFIFWYPTTRTAVAYANRLDGAGSGRVDRLEFDSADPNAPFIDRTTGSRFGIEGRAVSGPLKGQTLTWIDSVQCLWFAWAAENPSTEIQPASSEAVLVTPDAVTPAAIGGWRNEGFRAVVVSLDDDHPLESYRAASTAASSAGMDLYYWIEVARNKNLADAHPRWMASLGMHDDWRTRFPSAQKPKAGEITKAYPWVPIGYAEAFQAQLSRLDGLLSKVPPGYRGVLLNDLQAGPASCGCGHPQCRWALDYGVASTATKASVDDAAARFLIEVKKRVPDASVIPIWMTECEDRDLPAKKAPQGQTTGFCGDVSCSTSTCPKVFTKQLQSLLSAHPGPIALLTTPHSLGRAPTFHGTPGHWIESAVALLDKTPIAPESQSLPHDRLWMVVEGRTTSAPDESATRDAARRLKPSMIIVARIPIDQSYEPRLIAVE